MISWEDTTECTGIGKSEVREPRWGIARSLSALPLEPEELGANVDSTTCHVTVSKFSIFPHVSYLIILIGIPTFILSILFERGLRHTMRADHSTENHRGGLLSWATKSVKFADTGSCRGQPG